jgi:hypothetical protein
MTMFFYESVELMWNMVCYNNSKKYIMGAYPYRKAYAVSGLPIKNLRRIFIVKKRRFASSALLIMCMVVAIVLSVMPMSVLAANAADPVLTGTKLTTAHAGQTLAAGEYYFYAVVTADGLAEKTSAKAKVTALFSTFLISYAI